MNLISSLKHSIYEGYLLNSILFSLMHPFNKVERVSFIFYDKIDNQVSTISLTGIGWRNYTCSLFELNIE